MSSSFFSSMSGLRRVFRWPWRTRKQIADDIESEIDFHLDARTAELTGEGIPPDTAASMARREFGDIEAARRSLGAADLRYERRVQLGERLSGFARDIRFGIRTLGRSPGFTTIAVVTLAIGVGASTAIFSTVNGVLLRPLPFTDPDRVVMLWQRERGTAERADVAPGTFLDVRTRATSFDALAAVEPWGLDLLTRDGPESVRTWLVTERFFDILGTPPRLGRTFAAGDHVTGRHRVVVLSDALWRTRFAADSHIVGQTVVFDGAPHVVIGVMPSTFRFPPGRDLWAPKVIQPYEPGSRGNGYWMVVGRLASGATVSSAQSEASSIAAQLAREFPRTNATVDLAVVPLPEQLLGPSRPALLLLLGAAGLLLMIACANVANLMLSRVTARAQELGVRAALGAGRGRIIRLLAAEGAVLSVLGGGLGVVIASIGIAAIRALSPAGLPRADEIALDTVALAFAIGVSILTAALFGVAPAVLATRRALHDRVKDGGRTATTGRRRHGMRSGMVVAEVALSLMLLVGAGLLVRSFISLLRVDRGFQGDGVVALTVQAWDFYQGDAERIAFVRAATARLAAMPGVEAAGITSSLPLAEGIGLDEVAYTVVGQTPPTASDAPTTHVTVATPGYFVALRIAVRRGRGFSDADDEHSAPVVLISEAFARRWFSDHDPIGQQISLGFMGRPVARRVIGVVADLRQTGLTADPGPAVFLPHAQAPTGALTFTLRASGDPGRLIERVKRELRSMNGSMPVASATTVDALLADAVRERRFHLSLLAAFAVVALLLAGVGLYGVLSSAVGERHQEFAVRLALGATAPDIRSLVLREGALLVSTGVIIGTALAAAAAGMLDAMLFRVSPRDPVTFTGVIVTVAAAAIVAVLVPARRAAALDPLEALHER